MICLSCGGWTLAPIEQRWEALEELEKLVRSRGRLLIQGENVALFDLAKLQIVRVGRAGRAEESWWRYGRELSRRRERAHKVAQRGKIIDALVAMAIIGLPIWAFSDAERWIASARSRTFGREAWSGSAMCTRCGSPLKTVRFEHAQEIRVLPGSELSLGLPCAKCERRTSFELTGPSAVHTLRRVLAYGNFAGATEDDVRRATREIEEAGSAGKLVTDTAAESPSLSSLSRTKAFALEIAVNEAHERTLLDLEIRELHAQWQQAEQIAAIVDNELTFRLRRP